MSTRLSYVICTNPRSGSWLLGSALTDTKAAGDPREWFNDRPSLTTSDSTETHFCKQSGIPLPLETYAAYLTKVIERTSTSNGIFGMTSHRDQFTSMQSKLQTIPAYRDLDMHEIMEKAF